MLTKQNKTNNTQWDVIYGDGVITFCNPNTTIAFVRYNEQAEIEYIFVNPLYRKRGHATRLIMMVEQQTGRKVVPQEPISPLGRKLFKMEKTMTVGNRVPDVTFKYRVRTDGHPITYVDTTNGGENPFVFKDVTTDEIFAGKRVIVFSLPGAYTPTCSTYQVPGFEKMYNDFKDKGIDEIYVLSVNDTFVMRRWMIDQGVENIKFIPDGNGEFTEGMGMLNCMRVVGFGSRSRRYAMVVNDGVVEHMFVEPDSTPDDPDPYGVSSPETVFEYLLKEEIAELA